MQQLRTAHSPAWVAQVTKWWTSPAFSKTGASYLLPLVVLIVIVALRAMLGAAFDDFGPTFILFLLPVICASFVGGASPGVVATFVSGAVAYFLFLDPAFEVSRNSSDVILLCVFWIEGCLIAFAGGRFRLLVRALIERDAQLARSEARFRVAQEAARIGTYEWRPDTGESRWSENAEEIMGMARGTFAGTYDDSLRTTFPEDRAVVEAATAQLFADGQNQTITRVHTPEGETRWVRTTGSVLYDESGRIDRVVGVMMDVTEQRRLIENEQFLADATADLSLSLDYRSAIATVAKAAVPRFSDMAAVILVENGAFPGRMLEAVHRDPARAGTLHELEAFLRSRPDAAGMIGRAIRSGEPLYVPDFDAVQAAQVALSEEHRSILARLEIGSVICIPLRGMDRPLGGLIFATERGRRLSESDYQTSLELGRRASLAIENALLVEYSFEREAQAARANEALQLLADSGVTLSRTLNLHESMTSLAELVVPRFADVCSISLVDGDRPMQRVGMASATAELAAALESFASNSGTDRGLFDQASTIIRSGKPVFLPEVSRELIDSLSDTPEQAVALSAIAPRSLVLMPMTARGQTIGVMSFMRVQASPQFDRDDLSVAGQLARRTAISADNARLYGEATRANDAKDEFLGMMSHELRTPITVIHGGARVLRSRSNKLDEETREGLLNDIERESERLSRMLENLLALARAELDGEVVLEPVLLQRLLPRLLDSQAPITGRPITLASDGEPPAVAAEPGYIEHIVRNLVGNAMKYSPPDAPIEVVLSGREGGAAIKVMDRGFGIAGDEANKIFERFYRSDRTSRLAGGAGLGLAVCKRLVEAMSGEIWATPREGGGLEVGFSLPAYQEEQVEL